MKVKSYLEELKAKGWKQKEIAKVCDFSETYISDIFNGKETKIQTVEKIAKAFNIPLKVFIDDADPPRVLTVKQTKIVDICELDKEVENEIWKFAEKEKVFFESKK